MSHFYLTLEQDDFDKIPALQVCIAEALYDAEVVQSNPSAIKAEEIRTLRDWRGRVLDCELTNRISVEPWEHLAPGNFKFKCGSARPELTPSVRVHMQLRY